ncbi:hypothetical protein GLOIN_2v1868022 [Rhizophagus irregularis DAOM 181602=DAOM 197198]|uniref:F-box domain-containing protein n=2 Tax=Rhizophagus irregularis (strain DAOM 181602 / DAOM 197198 / MUCL 43194) TaxID=747089 RepID=A0A2P4QW04_RHIID|nr:hypothetical protein GLOIN_2v1868022 [Rhizophagus irregularis DAOM 181602=DAOM 197198]POG81797.1 hypothetical protein GLOIN_2v1868022 [Rhizophagus irregularis DAOM 181602=DAOM 197198]GBC40334.2 hypothetical protein GLOIN_2v1868022 [Rhizophagus irregularis DAOM 181602=DAOM 197198]|eukprot:XP_025188663.1 hypothetical protein GLOIN_2v1868022 [Rhizophagus irregularis DAOM 181602=DAOM 197198]
MNESPISFFNMACSKIFSGELPELTNEIIQYFRKDFSTLYSCILVNRLWCRLAIPLLWENPFPISYSKNYHFIKIYLNKLNEDDKIKLNEYGFNYNLSPSSTLFNYPSFIKYLNTREVVFNIKSWIFNTLVDKNHDYELVNLIYGLLLKVFIENEGILDSFEVMSNLEYFNNITDLILQNLNFTYNIRKLKLKLDISCQNFTQFLKFLFTNCNSISTIVLSFHYISVYNRSSLVEKYLSQLIISQHNLKKISFEYNMIYNQFLALKNSNCSNTLNTIIFYFIDFKNIINILQEVFDQLNVLESIHIFYCNSLNSDFVQQIIKVIKPFKLRTLFMDEILHVESLQLFVQKISNWLENLEFKRSDTREYSESKQRLLEFIIKYCKKIRYFKTGTPDNNNIYQLIENNQHSINYINIEVDLFNDHTDLSDLSSSVLQNLGQILPSKLEYLCLGLCINTSDLEIFLKNSQNTFIKKLVISYKLYDEGDEVLFYIKKYIMKKERVKYLVFDNNDSNFELFTLKNEVNEFKLHNIIVKKFSDLYIINPYDFIINNYSQY